MFVTRRVFLINLKRNCWFIIFAVTVVWFLIWLRENKLNGSVDFQRILQRNALNFNVHIFYQAHYRTVKHDGYYNGWNASDVDVAKGIASNYYPSLGLYSSNDPETIDIHMKQMKSLGIGVVVVSWWPPNHRNAPPLPLLFTYANKYGLKIALHIQDYDGRNVTNLHEYLMNFFLMYLNNPALYRTLVERAALPLLYVYNSHLIPWYDWHAFLRPSGAKKIRGSQFDAAYIGLVVEEEHLLHVDQAGFDGVYTYFAANTYTYGSTWTLWPYINDHVWALNKIFIPTVAPGFSGTCSDRNHEPIANRNDGKYYCSAWHRAVISRASFVSINSFNNWEEGTQIESARHLTKEVKWAVDYGGYSNHYMDLTQDNVEQFSKVLLQRMDREN